MQTKSVQICLFLTRLSIFSVFLVWSLDKFIRPDHASLVFQHFYFSPALSSFASYLIGALELLLSVIFVLGAFKTFSYGAIFILHLISTLSSYKQYLQPYEGIHLLFFAAWPMLAAIALLYIMRNDDILFSVKSSNKKKEC